MDLAKQKIEWKFNDSQPIYLQLIMLMQTLIVSGAYPPGSKVDPVRELAAQAGVNPNTMQKALAELERMGLVYSQRTSGRYITQDSSRIESLREELATECTYSYLEDMERLGYGRQQTLELFQKMTTETSPLNYTATNNEYHKEDLYE